MGVIVDGPTSTIPAEIIEADGDYTVSFVPTEVGEHSVDVRFGDTLVPGSPFKVMVGDPKRVVITERGNIKRKRTYCCLSFLATQESYFYLCTLHQVSQKNMPKLIHDLDLTFPRFVLSACSVVIE